MAGGNLGVPNTDPVVLHIEEVYNSTKVTGNGLRWICFVAGWPLTASRPDELRRHFGAGWHDASAPGGQAAWSRQRAFSVAFSDYKNDVGLTATRAATDAASWAAALSAAGVAGRPVAAAVETDPAHPARMLGWTTSVQAWRAQLPVAAPPAAAAAAATTTTNTTSTATNIMAPAPAPLPATTTTTTTTNNNNNNVVAAVRREDESEWKEESTRKRNEHARAVGRELRAAGARPARRWTRQPIEVGGFRGAGFKLLLWRPEATSRGEAGGGEDESADEDENDEDDE